MGLKTESVFGSECSLSHWMNRSGGLSTELSNMKRAYADVRF